MRKQLFNIIILFLITTGLSYAADTVIVSYTGNSVQCNKWGWVDDNIQTVWGNDCTPLEAKSLDGKQVVSLNTTDNQCGDNQYGDYIFNEGDQSIQFLGCYPFKPHAQIKAKK